MYFTSLVLTLFLITSNVFAQEPEHSNHAAPIVENNPQSATFQAVLQAGKSIQGQIIGVSSENGTGVNVIVNFYEFPPAEDGPFKYHIHEFPIPSDGNCTAAGGHLSPYGRPDTPPCDTAVPETCQPGDLSGKHGAISDTATKQGFQKQYLDLYLSTDPNSVSFIGNRSVVVHANNGTRLNCANFTQQVPDQGGGGGNSSRPSGYGPESYNPVNGGNGGGGNRTAPTLSGPTSGTEHLGLWPCLTYLVPVALLWL